MLLMTMHILRTVLTHIREDKDQVWTLGRVQALAGPEISAEACSRMLRRLVNMGALEQTEPGVWRRGPCPGDAQRDWYS